MKRAPRDRCRWTSEEDALLSKEWGENSLRLLRQKLGRSSDSIRLRARRIGLPCVPQGWVSVEAAAVHCGLSAATLLRLCVRHNVAVRRWYATRYASKGARRFVLLDDAAKAVETETREYETIAAGATRWGMPDQRLARWLAVAKVKVLRALGAKHRYVRSSDVDRVCKAHGWRRGRLTVNVAAKTLGVPWRVLKDALGGKDLGRCAEYTTLATARRALKRREAAKCIDFANRANRAKKHIVATPLNNMVFSVVPLRRTLEIIGEASRANRAAARSALAGSGPCVRRPEPATVRTYAPPKRCT